MTCILAVKSFPQKVSSTILGKVDLNRKMFHILLVTLLSTRSTMLSTEICAMHSCRKVLFTDRTIIKYNGKVVLHKKNLNILLPQEVPCIPQKDVPCILAVSLNSTPRSAKHSCVD